MRGIGRCGFAAPVARFHTAAHPRRVAEKNIRSLAILFVPCVLAIAGCDPEPLCGADLDYNEETGLCDCLSGGTLDEATGYCRYADGAITLRDGAVPMSDDGGEPDASTPDAGEQDAGTDACTTRSFYRDADGDGHGVASDSVTACVAPDGYAESDDDCNDTCESCLPGGVEACTEPALDEDCDGTSNEADTCSCTDGTSISCGTTEVGECAFGTQQCTAGAYGACQGAIAAATEACNGLDDDCDGTTDEGTATVFYRDADNDTFGNASVTMQACSAPTGYVTSSTDCNDSCATCRPGGVEVCDGFDNNCAGGVDEGTLDAFYADCDRDGYAPQGAVTLMACAAPSGGPSSCPTGGWTMTEPLTLGARDCADNDARAFPGQTMFFDTAISGVPSTRDFDFDCDGNETRRYTRTSFTTCGGGCASGAGWTGASVPVCGAAAELLDCFGGEPPVCPRWMSVIVQGCR